MKIIDALVITLGLDNSGFKKGAKETKEGMDKVKADAVAAAKVMQEQGKKAGEFFGNIRTELIALVGIGLSINSFKNLIVNTANSFAALGRSSAPLNMSARELDAWQHSAMAFGGTAEGFTSSMQSLSDSIYAFSMGKGGEQAIATLRALGISAKDASGKAKSMGQIYVEVSEEFKKRNLSAGQARQFGMGLGMDSATVNMLLEGPERVKKVFGEMYQNSGVTDDAVRRSQQFQITWAKIDQTFQAVRERLFTALIPYIEKLLVLLDRFAKWVSAHQAEINGFFTSTADTINTVVDAVGGVENALKILLAFVVGKWALGMAGAIGSVSTSLAGLIKNLAGVAARNPWLLMLVPTNNTPTQTEEMNELERLKRENWAINNPGVPYPEEELPVGEPAQHAQSVKRTKVGEKGAALLDNLRPLLVGLEKTFDLPQQLLESVAITESAGNPHAVSSAGAKGLFQFMPGTAADMGLKGNDVFDPEKSGVAAAKYLRQLMKMFDGDLNKVLAAYNWGMGNVQDKGLGAAPKETRDYQDKVLGEMRVGAGISAERYGNTYNRGGNSTTSTDTQIGAVNVYTQATDANGIAREMSGALRRNTLVSAANGGVS